MSFAEASLRRRDFFLFFLLSPTLQCTGSAEEIFFSITEEKYGFNRCRRLGARG